VCGERPPEDANLTSYRNEFLDVPLDTLPSHRLDVELLEALLQPLERPRIGVEYPFQQGGEKGRTVEGTAPVHPSPRRPHPAAASTGQSIGSSITA
jgi:hypothetical protein